MIKRVFCPDKYEEMKNIYQIIRFLVLTVLLAFPAYLRAAGVEGEEKAFSPKDVIFRHLGDEYGWEFKLPGDLRAEIPLPVIVRDYRGKWHVFRSTRIKEGRVHESFYMAEEGENAGKIESVDDKGNRYRPLDLSVTRNVLALIFCSLLLLALFLPMARWYKKNRFKAPGRGWGALEYLVGMLYDEIIKPVLGKDARKYAPYLLTLFFFILGANLLGLIVIFPGGANLTGNISVTLVLALCTFVVVNISGTRIYWKEIFWPDVPLWLKFPIPIMPFIEILGIFTKPLALMIRLFANMMGGHLIALVLVSIIFLFSAFGTAVMGTTTVFSVAFSFLMKLLDVLISFIQAYVFMMLSTLFIGLARVRGESGEKV